MFIWTDALLSRALRMRAGGVSAAQIAAELIDEYGRSPTRSAVLGKFHRVDGATLVAHAPKARHSILWPPERVEALRKLVDQGLTVAECAERLTRQFDVRLAPHSVYFKARKLGMQFAGRGRRTIQKRSPVPRVQPPAPAKPSPTSVPDGTAGCGLMDLTWRSCRWIDGDPSGQHSYCAQTKVRGSYCARHAAMAYQPPAERKKPVGSWLDKQRRAA